VDSARPDNNGDGTSPATAWKTVHYAIGQITNGDVLNVAEGIYSVVANGEANSPLTITQSNVTIQGAAGGTSILEGSSCASWSPGIEIASAASNVTIRNLAVRNFECDASDTGVRIASGATGSIIESCEIYNNDYGIYVDESSPEIRKNRIYDNYTGIYVYGGTGIASPSISNNLIYDTSGAMNNGIYVSASSGTASPTIHHNTIDGGTSVGISTTSGAGSGTPDIQYNIITNFGMYGIDDSLGSNIDYNDVWNNTSSNYGGLTTPGLNDINPPNGLDPLYQDPSIGNYELQFGSPCIDKIPSGASDPVADDIDGNPRPQDGDLDGTAEHDMGCYEYPVYTVNVAIFPVGGGSITATGINCPGDCTETYISGTNVTLTATPAPGYQFDSWSGDLSGSTNPDTVTMDSNKSVTAVFVPVYRTLNVAISPDGGGSVTATGIDCPGDCTEIYFYGTNVTLTATPAPGYEFDSWSGDLSGSTNPDTVTMDSSKSVTAFFAENIGNNPPDTPTAVTPADEAIWAAGPVTIDASAFSDPEDDAQSETYWLVGRADRP
jgi:uncharacterized repeat protein (TIGR02543 family)